jgi:hypothetical protein
MSTLQSETPKETDEDEREDQTRDLLTPMDSVSRAVMRMRINGNRLRRKFQKEPSLPVNILPLMEMGMRIWIKMLHHTVYVMDQAMER